MSLPRFDAQAVPIVAVDSHLPAIDPSRLTAEAISRCFLDPAPWKPEALVEPPFTDRQPSGASVLITVVMRDRPTVLLTRRSPQLSNHPGQIAFPGGRVDPEDRSTTHTALREAHEEVGLPHQHVVLLGCLPVYKTGSAFDVTPVVALWNGHHALRPDRSEVDLIFEVPLDHLMNPRFHRWHEHEWQGVHRRWLSMPYQAPDGDIHFIWGATAGMLRSFYGVLAATMIS